MERDDLFALPPGEFVAARDALARGLKAGGDAKGAKEVKALRRPSVGAWAVNRVARDQPDLVGSVVEAGRALAAALEGGDREALRQATTARRDAVVAATRAAVALAGAQHRDEIADTFEAAVSNADAAELVTAGRLDKGLTPTAVFAPLGDAPLPVARTEPAVDADALRAARARAEQADQALAAARRALTDAERAARSAWADVERLGLRETRGRGSS